VRRFAALLLLASCSRQEPLPSSPEELAELLALPPEATRSRVELGNRAYEKLCSMGTAALPSLLRRIDDRRRAIVTRACSRTWLGLACADAMHRIVGVPLPKAWDDPDYSFLAGHPIDRQWWFERDNWTLRGIRVEAALFGLAAAERTGEKRAPAAFRESLKGLGAPEEGSALERFRKLQQETTIPGTPQSLVEALAVPATGDFIARRFAWMRSRDAFWALVNTGTAAFPAVVKGLLHPDIDQDCLEILRQAVEEDVPEEWPGLAFLRKETAAEWWMERADWTLPKLRLEAARHHRASALLTGGIDEETRRELLRSLQERIKRLEREAR
jgi:hypothetical protein